MKPASGFQVDKKFSCNKDDNMFVVPPIFEDVKKPKKDAFSSMEVKPALVFPDFYEKGLDNPAYYDPADARKAARLDTKKQKFTSKCVPGEPTGAKLTKIPGLNIWRLDFRKPPPRKDTTRRASSPWYRLATSLAMLAVLALVVSGIAVIVHAVKGGLIFGLPWFPFDDETETYGVSHVAAHFRIMNREFVPELDDPTTVEHLQLVSELKHSLDVLFMDSPLVNLYNASDNFEFTNGSVVVRCVVRLNRPLLDGAQRVGFAFVRALEDGKGILPPGMFYVDVHTVRFAALKMDSQSAYDEDLGYEAGQWSEWSSCVRNGSCDSARIRVRRRNCGPPEDACGGSRTEVVETRPCLCPLPGLTATLTTASLLLPGRWDEWSAWSSCLTFRNLCDPQQIQRRTRTCVGRDSKQLPNTVCYRKTGESAMQIRHCLCNENTNYDDRHQKSDDTESGLLLKETTLQIENDYMHWVMPVD